jgi:hypothetical protein
LDLTGGRRLEHAMAYATEAPAAHAAAATAQEVVFMRDGVLGVLARIPALLGSREKQQSALAHAQQSRAAMRTPGRGVQKG